MKMNLKDLTFLFPIRIDSIERCKNIIASIEFLMNHFDTNIEVIEADEKKNLLLKEMLPEQVEYTFIEDYDPVFYRTKYLNYSTVKLQTPFVAIWDADVIICRQQILKCMDLLRNNLADMTYPYDGTFWYIDPIISRSYLNSKDFKVLSSNMGKMVRHEGQAVGGAFIVNKSKYIKAGLENKNFYGWGPEDRERKKRWEILDYRVARIKGPLFHLYHPRTNINSNYPNEYKSYVLFREYLRICRMDKNRLCLEIETWNSGLNANVN